MPAILPALLSVLANKGLGLLAGAIEAKGKQVIEKAIGVQIPDDPKQLTDDKLVELQKAQMDHEEFLVNAAIKEQELYLADTQSARDRDAKIVASTGQRNKRADAMIAGAAVCVILIMVAVIWILQDFDDFQKSILTLILGRALGYVDQAFNFEFGTTRTSRMKDESIERLTKK